jgi:hypothetical protein
MPQRPVAREGLGFWDSFLVTAQGLAAALQYIDLRYKPSSALGVERIVVEVRMVSQDAGLACWVLGKGGNYERLLQE